MRASWRWDNAGASCLWLVGVGVDVLSPEFPPFATLGNVMPDAGKNETSEAGHNAGTAWVSGSVNLAHCHRNPSGVN